jgi:hypothetical protein
LTAIGAGNKGPSAEIDRISSMGFRQPIVTSERADKHSDMIPGPGKGKPDMKRPADNHRVGNTAIILLPGN